jgi:15-cis-phytoene synthase
MTSIVRSDSLYCEKVVRRHARAFTLATYFLPPRKRRASFAFYSFAKAAADLARSCGPDRKAAARKLQEYRRNLAEAVEGRPRGAIFREVRWGVREFDLDASLLFSLLDCIARNDTSPAYVTWDDLERHCDRIASTVGILCARVLGIPGGPTKQEIAISHARTLGVAMQLTAILRDSVAHARDGRCILPEEELARFSLSRNEVVGNQNLGHDARWRRLMTFEIGRARALYERSLPGISMLAEDSQRCAAACAIGYAAVLDALEHSTGDSLSSRASLSTLARLGILWEAWRYRSRAIA